MKQQAIDAFDLQSLCHMPQARNPAHINSQGLLGLEDRPRAKGIAAVERERVVKDVEDACHGILHCTNVLNEPSTASC